MITLVALRKEQKRTGRVKGAPWRRGKTQEPEELTEKGLKKTWWWGGAAGREEASEPELEGGS